MTHSTDYLWAATAVMAAVTFLLRAFPFIAFSRGNGQPPALITYIGRVICPAVIAMLVVYCLSKTTILSFPYGIPELIAVLTCLGLHWWKHNSMLSILASTALYMILLQTADRLAAQVHP